MFYYKFNKFKKSKETIRMKKIAKQKVVFAITIHNNSYEPIEILDNLKVKYSSSINKFVTSVNYIKEREGFISGYLFTK